MFSPGTTQSSATNFGNNNKGVIGDNNKIDTINHVETEGPVIATGGAFYTYIHSRSDDNVERIVTIFSSRDVCDEWWRAVSTSDIPQLRGNVQRETPQFYSHLPGNWNVINFFTDARMRVISDKFRGKMFMTRQNDRGGRGVNIIPLQTIVDRTNGSSFTVRSVSNPRMYWDIDAQGRIFASEISRASFVVTAVGLAKKTIMVKSDRIIITTSQGAVVLGGPSPIVKFNNNLVRADSGQTQGHQFTLGDLENGRFLVDTQGSLCYSTYATSGMAWVLDQ